MKYILKCLSCGENFGSEYDKQICKYCDGILDVVYIQKPLFVDKMKSFWDFERLMPNSTYQHYDVGDTRLIKQDNNLYIKKEFDNPTHSFKDRGSVVEIAKAIEYGYDEIVCASTGNMAYSLAYYGKLMGLKLRVFISSNANKDKIRNIKKIHDAVIINVDGDFTKAQHMALAYSKKTGCFLVGDYCYRKEGQRSVSYELAYQIKDLDAVFIPIGNATLFSAMFKGFNELYNFGIIKKIPKMIGAQAKNCAPVANAIKSKKITYVKPKTAADAIAVGMPTYGYEALSAIKSTVGDIGVISEKDLVDAQSYFYKQYGLIAELGGIAALAVYKKFNFSNQRSAIIVTGSNI